MKRVLSAYAANKVKGNYTPDSAAALVEKVGGAPSEAKALSTKILGESGGNPKAVGHDPGGTTGLGLWQLTTGVGNDALINKHGGPQAMLKPKPNAKAALDLYRSGGLGNWYAPSSAPGNPKNAPHGKPSREDLKTLVKSGIEPKRAKATKKATDVSPAVAHRFQKIEKAANSVAGTPYVLGGGHGSSFEKHPSTLDCSGAVSRVLHAAGVLDHPLTSGQMGSVLKPGPGAVTVYYNSGHTFMKIGNRYWGTSVGDSGSGGLGKHPSPSSGYLSEYSVGHVPGLGAKAANAMGVKLTAGGSASAGGGGTTASFSGGTTQTTPGFSKSPIKLTARQKLGKVNKIYGPAQATSPGPSSETAGLSRRYGHPAV